MPTGPFFDPLEARPTEERERALLAVLPVQVAHARSGSPYYARLLAGIEAREISSRSALAQLPLTRKSDLHQLQRGALPFGGLAATAVPGLARVFVSPGPIYDPEGRGRDYWRMARALYAAGFRPGDLVHNCFSYHFTPAGSMLETGAHALGCAVIPAGVGQTETQVATIADLRPSGYVGTPSFLRIIVDKAAELGADISSLRRALVSGEALPPSLRAYLGERGIATLQCYGTADLGLIAYESEAREGMIADEQVLLEIVRPGTGDPVADGEVGEVVVTTLNRDYPLLRFATGDLSAVLPGASPCGRTNTRIKGWLGRADQTTKVRGMFVHPAQVVEVAKRHAELGRVRLVVDNPGGQDSMTLHGECAGDAADLASALETSLRELTKLRGEVRLCRPGELPNDGKIIEDRRKYE